MVASTRGQALGSLGRYVEADAVLRAAIVDAERSLGPTNGALVDPLQQRAWLLLTAGQHGAGIASFERAIAISDHSDSSPQDTAELRLAFARALAELGDGKRAIAVAREARAAIVGVPHTEQLLADIDQLLSQQVADRGSTGHAARRRP
jgi:hypothetical protein